MRGRSGVESRRCVIGLGVKDKTYHHSHPGLLSIRLLLNRIVQDYIQEDVVAAQGARDAAGAVELD